jgi:hypothetical protein
MFRTVPGLDGYQKGGRDTRGPDARGVNLRGRSDRQEIRSCLEAQIGGQRVLGQGSTCGRNNIVCGRCRNTRRTES